MELIPFPFKKRLDAKAKGEQSPPCVACGEPGPMTPMFTNVKPDLCQKHYTEAMAALARTLGTQ